jgi:hypothetical protein
MVMRLAALSVLAGALAAGQPAPAARDFGRMLWTNAKGLVSADNAAPALLGATAAGSSTLFDRRVQDYFGGERVAPAVGSAGNVVGNSLTLGAAAGGMFWASYRGRNERFKSMSFDLAQAVVLDAALTVGVKSATRRERPDGSNQLSFHSGHASSTTAFATVVAHHYPKAAIPAYLVAGFVGFSRIEKNKHWLSDVVAGHAIGFLVGRTVARGHNPMQIGRLHWAPAVAPGGGLMINADISLDPTHSQSAQ